MINFICKFVDSLSEKELDILQREIYRRKGETFQARMSNCGPGLELSEFEKDLVKKGFYIEPIKEYRARNGEKFNVLLRDARIAIEAYRNQLRVL